MLEALTKAAAAYDRARDDLDAATMAAFPVDAKVTFRHQRMGRWYTFDATVRGSASSSFGHYHAGYIVITNDATGASRTIHAQFHASRGELLRKDGAVEVPGA